MAAHKWLVLDQWVFPAVDEAEARRKALRWFKGHYYLPAPAPRVQYRAVVRDVKLSGRSFPVLLAQAVTPNPGYRTPLQRLRARQAADAAKSETFDAEIERANVPQEDSSSLEDSGLSLGSYGS